MRTRGLAVVVFGAAFISSMALRSQSPPAWPDTPTARLQAFAMMQTLNADLLATRSATLTLERWCRDHRLADDPTIRARVAAAVQKPATPEQRQHLGVAESEPVKFRHVQLRCGDRVLSEADNWYVPARLTPDMNRLLETTDTAFGKVVQPLAPYRETLAVRILWSPLPDDWDRLAPQRAAPAGGLLRMPDALFEHHALVYTGGHLAFSEVDEVYQRAVLAVPPPAGLR
jgi:chorismate-pyruvate lyase